MEVYMLDRSASRQLDDKILSLLESHGLTDGQKQTIVSLDTEQGIKYLCLILTQKVQEYIRSNDGQTSNCMAVLRFARIEAANRKHGYIGTEHILLGITSVQNCTAYKLFERLGVSAREVYSNLEKLLRDGTWNVDNVLPFTSRAKKVFELATTHAITNGDLKLKSEYLLIGLLQEEKGIAAVCLTDMGITVKRLQEELSAMRAENRE